MTDESIPNSKHPTERRLFITEDGFAFYKLFGVKQGSNGADLYFTWPDPNATGFIVIDRSKTPWEIRVMDSKVQGRLSFHASGQAHFAEGTKKANPQFVVQGSQLFNINKKEIGVRHLFTALIRDPKLSLPENSPAFARKTDDSLLTKNLRPVVLILFAVPNGLAVSLKMSVGTKYFTIPEDLPGMGFFFMKHHGLLWIAYQQKHLEWPKNSHIAYSDGHCVPLFFGKESNDATKGHADFVVCEPSYKLDADQKKLTIEILAEEP